MKLSTFLPSRSYRDSHPGSTLIFARSFQENEVFPLFRQIVDSPLADSQLPRDARQVGAGQASGRKGPARVALVEKVLPRERQTREIQRDGSQEDKAADRRPAARDIKPLTVNQELFLERNENNLLRVYVDMNKPRGLAIMSDHSVGGWVNPCKEERLVDSRGNEYEVMFYLARRPGKFRALNEHLMTPVVFLNDRVYTTGRYGLKKLRASAQLTDRQVHGCRSI